MLRAAWMHMCLAVVIALAAQFLIRLHNAGGVGNALPSLTSER